MSKMLTKCLIVLRPQIATLKNQVDENKTRSGKHSGDP
jgi:hypothetical protein